MQLFGEGGYKETTVAKIEAAAGLSPGSGSMYKHFSPKEELLAAGVEAVLYDRAKFLRAVEPGELSDIASTAELQAFMQSVAEAGLERMESDRNIARLLFRGLEAFPDLLTRYRDGEIAANHQAVTAMLTDLNHRTDDDVDWPAIAAVLIGAIAHYWLLTDLFGTHPSGVSQQRYTAAAAFLVAHVQS